MSFILDHSRDRVGAESFIANVSLCLDPGTMSGLPGPTPSSRTTLMRSRAGLDRPISGRLVAHGMDVTGTALPQRSVAGSASDWSIARCCRVTRPSPRAPAKRGLNMNPPRDPDYWFAKAEKDGNLACRRKLADETPPGATVDDDALVKGWPLPPRKG